MTYTLSLDAQLKFTLNQNDSFVSCGHIAARFNGRLARAASADRLRERFRLRT